MADRDIELWKLAFEGVKAAALVAGAAWAFWRFRRERTDAPQIAFAVDVRLHGPSEGKYAAEYVLTFENKGKTRVEVSEIVLLVRGIRSGEKLDEWEGKEPRLLFPHKLVDNKKVIPPNYGYIFFEPGIKQDYKYVSIVPEDFKFILVHGLFYYKDRNPHSAERVVTVGEVPPKMVEKGVSSGGGA